MYHTSSIHVLKDILTISKFHQSWIKLLSKYLSVFPCVCMCMHACMHACRILCLIFSAPLDKCQGAWLLDHMVRLRLVLNEINRLSSKVALSFCIFTSSEWKFLFHILPPFVFMSILDFGHFNKCVMISVISYCLLICISLKTYDMDHLLIYLCFVHICLIRCLLRFLTHFLIQFFFSYVEFQDILLYFEYKRFIRCVFCRCFLCFLWIVFSFSWHCLSQSRQF